MFHDFINYGYQSWIFWGVMFSYGFIVLLYTFWPAVERVLQKMLFQCVEHKTVTITIFIILIVCLAYIDRNLSGEKLVNVFLNILISVFCGIVVQALGTIEKEKTSLPSVFSAYNCLRKFITNIDIIFYELSVGDSKNVNTTTIDAFFAENRLYSIFDMFQKQANNYSKFLKDKCGNEADFKRFLSVARFISGRWDTISNIGENLLNLLSMSDYKYKSEYIKEIDYFLNENSIKFFIYWLAEPGNEAVACCGYYRGMDFQKSIENIKVIHKLSHKMYDYLKKFDEYSDILKTPDLYGEKDKFDEFLEDDECWYKD